MHTTKQVHATKRRMEGGVVGARETSEDNKGPEHKQSWEKKHKQIVEDRNTEPSVFGKKEKHTAWTAYSQAGPNWLVTQRSAADTFGAEGSG